MQPSAPIMVHVVQEPVKSTTLSDVLVGAFGLTGALLIVALVAGLVLGAVLIGFGRLRGRNKPHQDPGAEIHISPYA